MFFDIAKVLLRPLVAWQGHRVRLRAAQLPEAQGNREGVSGVGRVCLRVLIVGDSSAAGVGARTQSQALAGRLGEALSQRLGGAVVWQVVARRGDTTLDSTRALSRLALRPADVMVTTLGVADLVRQVPTKDWVRQLEVLDRVAMKRAGVRQIVHCGLPPMRTFPLPNPLRWVLGREEARYNRAVSDWVAGSADRWWLPLPFENQLATDSVLMAEDGFHPGPAVYALWAEQLAGLISTKIVPRLPETTPTRQLPPQTLIPRRMRKTS